MTGGGRLDTEAGWEITWLLRVKLAVVACAQRRKCERCDRIANKACGTVSENEHRPTRVPTTPAHQPLVLARPTGRALAGRWSLGIDRLIAATGQMAGPFPVAGPTP